MGLSPAGLAAGLAGSAGLGGGYVVQKCRPQAEQIQNWLGAQPWPGSGSWSSIWAPQRWHRMLIPKSFMAQILARRQGGSRSSTMVPAIVLAAGASARMGRPKALLPTDVPGETFIGRLVATLIAGGVDDVVVVTRPGLSLAAAFDAQALPPRVVENQNPDLGQLSSLVTGLAVVDRPGVQAVMVTIVDQPLVTPATVAALLAAYGAKRAPIVRPARGEQHGHPVIFDRSLFGELRSADRSRGAKAVVRAHQAEILDLPIDDEGAFVDIDTPADYERVMGKRF